MLLAIAGPTLVRAALSPVLGANAAFASYYPAVLVTTLLLGWRPGVAATLLSAALANYLFVPPQLTLSLTPRDVAATGLFVLANLLIVLTAQTLRRTVRELEAAARREAALNLELAHRVNNNLAVVQALAHQTARATPQPEAFYEALSGRLVALGQAHKVLSTGRWEHCELPTLAEEALSPFRGLGPVMLRGPACILPPISCVPLVMALHELGTNAAKYGALSGAGGWVELSWSLDAADRVLRMVWREFDGPPVKPPKRRGLGSRVLAPQGGLQDVRLSFPPSGVVCELDLAGVEPVGA